MTSKKILRVITYSPEITDGEPIYYSSNCLPIKAIKFEPAGHSFHSAALKLNGYEDKNSNSDDKDDAQKDISSPYGSSSNSNKIKKKSNEQQDYYTLLGLGHLRYLATEDQIKKSYRVVALRHHPDKMASLLHAVKNEKEKEKKREEVEEHFKSVQKAYEILIDPTKRKLYDSGNVSKEDDAIPDSCSREDFFKIFGPYFVRNGHWSINKPVPSLGDETTPLKEVDKFYSFWYNFKSWREFQHEDECDLEEAESREEKRWMERQNAKLREGARKEEYARIRSLVDNAYKRDPRIIDRKEREKAEKRKKKDAKYLSKRLEEEEAARVAEEERVRREKEEREAAEAALNNKKMREKEKKLLRKERSRLRTVSASVVSEHVLRVSQDDVENLCMSLDIEKLRLLCDKLEKKEKMDQAKFLKEVIEDKDSLENNSDVKNTPKENGFSKFPDSVLVNGKSVECKKEKMCKSNGDLPKENGHISKENGYFSKDKRKIAG